MERKYKIDKGVSVPPNGRERWNELYDTIAKMQKGDSVLLSFEGRNGQANLLSAIRTGAQKSKIKVITRKLGDNELRFWRVK